MNQNNEFAELKKQVRRQGRLLKLSIAGWMAVLSLGLLGLTSKDSPFFDSIRVRRLAVIDKNGVERLILDTDNRIVNLNGKQEKRGPQSSGIILQNEKGDEVGGFVTNNCIGLDDIQCPSITAIMLDGYSKHTRFGAVERVGLFSTEDGTAGLLLVDLKGNTRTTLLTDSSLNSVFSMKDGKGVSRIEGTVTDDGRAIWAEDGK